VEAQPVRAIVVGYDGSTAAERALERAAVFARAFAARIIVVSVAPPTPAEPLAGPGAFGLGPYYSYAAQDQEGVLARDERLWEEHRAEVDRFLTAAGVSAEFAGAVGEPAERIVELADKHDADLIVVGTREPGFLERVLGGSVSGSVARRAHCDVLIVHPDRPA
jgi:nucleotide-binding universal stress UspA family protein